MSGRDSGKPSEPWRQRLIRSLLYGRNVDRNAKARARVGFAILAFAAVYAVIAGRLVMFAIGADSHIARRAASQDAIATARPDLDTIEVRDRLSTRKGFVWLKREISPAQQQAIHKLGIPGIGFLRENKRVYPTGAEVAHLIGLVNI